MRSTSIRAAALGLAALGWLAGVASAVDRVSSTQKGSLLIFPKVELRWDEHGTLIQDTFLDLTNDYPGNVAVQMYFVNGDPPWAPAPARSGVVPVLPDGRLVESVQGLAYSDRSLDVARRDPVCTIPVDPPQVDLTLRPGDSSTLQKCVCLDPVPPKIDVVIAMDLSATMGEEANNLKLQIINIITTVRGATAADVEFGLVSYEDYPNFYRSCGYSAVYGIGSDRPFRVNAPIGSTDAQVVAAVNAMVLGNGWDLPQSYGRVFWEAAQPDSGINYRSDALKIMINFGDDLPHDCNLGRDLESCPVNGSTGRDPGRDGAAGTGDDIDWQDTALAAVAAADIQLIQVFSGSPGVFCAWQQWMATVGGAAVQINPDGTIPGDVSLPDMILDLIATAASTVNQLVLTPNPECPLTITTDPPSAGPLDVSEGATVCFSETIAVPADLDPAIHEASCVVSALADGALIGQQLVNVTTYQERAHPGYNWVDNMVSLTANEPAYWSVLTGFPKGVSPYVLLDPAEDGQLPGRPDPDGSGQRVLRGFVIAYASDAMGNTIRWNHLKGDALLVDYAHGTAWEYNAYAFRAGERVAHGSPTDGTDPTVLELNGTEYEKCFAQLLLDFYASGSSPFSRDPFFPTVDTDLTLLPMTLDLRQDHAPPTTTKADFTIWNMNETKLTSTRRCITFWDQRLLSAYTLPEVPNNFLVGTLLTDKGKAQIYGLASSECNRTDPLVTSVNAPLLGVQLKRIGFEVDADAQSPMGDFIMAGGNLVGAGTTTSTPPSPPDPFIPHGSIKVNVGYIPPEKPGAGLRQGQSGLAADLIPVSADTVRNR